MIVMPMSETKGVVIDTILSFCLETKAKRVFTLLGTEGSLYKKLPKTTRVVSAEYQEAVRILQKRKFPKCKHYTSIMEAMSSESNYDVVWLDFFGNCTMCPRVIELGAAMSKINKGGALFITSLGRRKRNLDHKGFISMFKRSFPTFDIDSIKYNNNGNPMYLYAVLHKC